MLAGCRSRSKSACRSPRGSAAGRPMQARCSAWSRDAYGLPDDWRERAAALGRRCPGLRRERRLHRARDGDRAGADRERSCRNAGAAGQPARGRCRQGRSSPRGTGSIAARCQLALFARSPARAATISRRRPSPICPAIADVLAALNETEAFLVRMSGSGATCFALFREPDMLREASARLAQNQPDWWQLTGNLR